MPELGGCAGCGGALWQEANGEPKFCDTCLADGTAERGKAETAPAEEAAEEVPAEAEKPAPKAEAKAEERTTRPSR